MIKHTVTFTNDFSDEEITQDLYFNLRLAELQRMITMEGWDERLKWVGEEFNIDNMSDRRKMQEFWEELIHRSYGVREGNEFVQSEELSDKFMRSAQYDALIGDILYTDNSSVASRFITGLFPKKIVERIESSGGLSEIEKKVREMEKSKE